MQLPLKMALKMALKKALKITGGEGNCKLRTAVPLSVFFFPASGLSYPPELGLEAENASPDTASGGSRSLTLDHNISTLHLPASHHVGHLPHIVPRRRVSTGHSRGPACPHALITVCHYTCTI